MPFQSEAQRRKFYAMKNRGEISGKTVEHWEEATGDRKLPERVKKSAAYEYGVKLARTAPGAPISPLTAGATKAPGIPPLPKPSKAMPTLPNIKPIESPAKIDTDLGQAGAISSITPKGDQHLVQDKNVTTLPVRG